VAPLVDQLTEPRSLPLAAADSVKPVIEFAKITSIARISKIQMLNSAGALLDKPGDRK
jgi:hypothetical protein